MSDANDASKKELDFERIFDELRRQFDILMKLDDSHDVKAGVKLGFIMLIVVQITLNQEYTNLVASKSVPFMFFVFGFAAVLGSFVAGIMGFRLRKYQFGPEVPKLLVQWDENKCKNYEQNIFSAIYFAYEHNRIVKRSKEQYVRVMLLLFVVGLVFIVLSKIALMMVQI